MNASESHPHPIIQELTSILGAEAVSADPRSVDAVARDQLRRRRAFGNGLLEQARPIATVNPRSTEDVVAIVGAAGRHKIPLVQYGGGTGLMGGALSVQPGIVLDMRSMNRVLDISKEDRTATVQAGTVLADLSACLEPHGLILGHDPWTVPIATVGGTISTNSLGYRGGKYGGMADQVLGIEAVMADGTVLRTRPVARSSAGPRLHQLFAGAEGQFGVITAATLRVFPMPERRDLVALDFPSFEHGFRVALDMHALGMSPAVLDFGAPPGEPGRMYLGFEGFAEEVEACLARARSIWRRHKAEEADREEADEWWEDRHVSRERLQSWRASERHDPVPGTTGSAVFDYLHMALPASRVLTYIQQAEAIFARRGVSPREWGLWHGPELLSTVLHRRTDTPEELAEAAGAVDDALRLAQDLGGSMEYVHGVGVRYAHLMEREHGSGLNVLRAIKRALDPGGLLNPGKLGL